MKSNSTEQLLYMSFTVCLGILFFTKRKKSDWSLSLNVLVHLEIFTDPVAKFHFFPVYQYICNILLNYKILLCITVGNFLKRALNTPFHAHTTIIHASLFTCKARHASNSSFTCMCGVSVSNQILMSDKLFCSRVLTCQVNH